MGKIFYIMGKSASGKDKIYGRIAGSSRLHLKPLILYTTRPIRRGEVQGKQYFFVDDTRLQQLEGEGKVIEKRSYDTVHGVWSYFTVDDGQIYLDEYDYLGIGTLESYGKLKEYFGDEKLCPIYIEVEDGERLARALKREGKQDFPKYAEMCRRFLADCEDFSETNIMRAGIDKRFNNVNLADCIQEVENYILDISHKKG